MEAALYAGTFLLAFANVVVLLVYSKIRVKCRSRLLVTVLTWLLLPYVMSIFYQPQMLTTLVKDLCEYNSYIGFGIYVLVMFVSFYALRKDVKQEINQWTVLYGSSKKESDFEDLPYAVRNDLEKIETLWNCCNCGAANPHPYESTSLMYGSPVVMCLKCKTEQYDRRRKEPALNSQIMNVYRKRFYVLGTLLTLAILIALVSELLDPPFGGGENVLFAIAFLIFVAGMFFLMNVVSLVGTLRKKVMPDYIEKSRRRLSDPKYVEKLRKYIRVPKKNLPMEEG